MPKRTNTLQQLVFLLQHQLAENATVTESKMLRDPETDGEVEVDIVVESTLGNTQIAIGFECTDRSRTSTVEWVRGMIEKHRPLEVDKTVLVSRLGFSDEAQKKARAHNVLLLGIEDAENGDWKSYVESFHDLRIAGFRFSILESQVTFAVPPDPKAQNVFRFDTPVRVPGEKAQVSLRDMVQSLPHRSDIAQKVMQEWIKSDRSKRESQFKITATYSPPPGATIEDCEGNKHEITSIKVSLAAQTEQAPLLLESAKLQGESIAYGKTRDVIAALDQKSEGEILVTLFENEIKGKRGAILFTQHAINGTRVFPISLVDKDEDGKS